MNPVSFPLIRLACTNLVTPESPVPLPRWAQPHDLATVVEFARMTQAALDPSRNPTSADVVDFVGALAADFEARYADVTWGEDADFLEATERAFAAAAKPLWLAPSFLAARVRRAETPRRVAMLPTTGPHNMRDVVALDLLAFLRDAQFSDVRLHGEACLDLPAWGVAVGLRGDGNYLVATVATDEGFVLSGHRVAAVDPDTGLYVTDFAPLHAAMSDYLACGQAERDDEACDAAGRLVANALREAGFFCDDYGDGILAVPGWREGWELRVCVGVERGDGGERLLADIEAWPDEGFNREAISLANNLPQEPVALTSRRGLDIVVEQVRELFRQRDGGAA